jgi:DHA2 family multidrug resistance protein
MWKLGHLTTVAGEADARYPLIIRGIALGFLFTPINNVAYANLKPSEAQEASGLINLARQLGGSFGIAIITTYLQSRTALHRADLVANTYAANPAFAERLQGALQHFIALGYSFVKAQAMAYAAIDQALTAQALMLSYNDTWMLILKSFVLTAPAILVIRKPKGRAAPGEMH